MPVYRRSSGLTQSEQVLKAVCEKSFLSFWSYPNLFRKRGTELCDLLVVFGDDVLIFSDKSCAFPSTGNTALDWSRWFDRSIRHSVAQVHGAERWLREHPERIFLDAKCEARFPFMLPSRSAMRVHRVIVATGAGARCREETGCPRGSLVQCGLRTTTEPQPFHVGWVDAAKPYVHVLDDVTLQIVMNELDTTSDFIAYLRKKQDLADSGRLGWVHGEEDLLATYILTMNAAEEHAFPDDGILMVGDDLWTGVTSRPEFAARKAADKVSYLWDFVIEEFAKNMLGGTLAAGADLSFSQHEIALRTMASESRLARRMLGGALNDIYQQTAPGESRVRVALSGQRPGVGYVFSIHSRARYGSDYEKYRGARAAKLEAYCHVAKHLFPALETIIGFAAEPRGVAGGSEDLLYLDASPGAWTVEQADLARRLHEQGGLMRNASRAATRVDEYPT